MEWQDDTDTDPTLPWWVVGEYNPGPNEPESWFQLLSGTFARAFGKNAGILASIDPALSAAGHVYHYHIERDGRIKTRVMDPGPALSGWTNLQTTDDEINLMSSDPTPDHEPPKQEWGVRQRTPGHVGPRSNRQFDNRGRRRF